MNAAGTVSIINFHGIGYATRPFEPGEESYWISEKLYQQLLDVIADAPPGSVKITFDDSNASDIEIGLPGLQARGLKARFFVLSGKLDTKGYLSVSQMRQLHAQGMPIGLHGHAHVKWSNLDSAGLDIEISTARKTIEDKIGAPVTEVAIPFGAYNRRVINTLKAAGFKTIYTSDGGWARSNAWIQPRTSVRKDTRLEDIAHLIANGTGWRQTLTRNLRSKIKQLR